MEQGFEVAVTTGTRRFLHALRPLLMLGGYVVVWWCLATGTAQANDGGHDHLGTTTKSLARSADKVVDHPAHHAARPHHTATKVTRTVRQHVTPAVSTVKATVQSSPVAPVVKVAHTVVQPVVTKAHRALETAPLHSVILPAVETPKSIANATESSTLQGETSPIKASVAPCSAALVDGSAAGLGDPSTTTLQGQRHTAPSSPMDHGRDGRALGTTGASSVQSGSGAGSAATLLETGLTELPVTDGTLACAPAGRHIAGPAYPPSSSPD